MVNADIAADFVARAREANNFAETPQDYDGLRMKLNCKGKNLAACRMVLKWLERQRR